jgi:uncharacterized protein YndB with AHSA1/START domain/class 3 adenylate cyclase
MMAAEVSDGPCRRRGGIEAMLPKPESACFVIADISGYTNFLAAVELDHAQDIIADLMDTVVRGLRPPFRLAKFEGDAAFCYAVTEKVDGSLLQDSIESAYFAFRRRMRNIKAASLCECDACRTMQKLDFKFVVHHGEMIKQKMGGREELAGRDVIVVHRLLKNSVNERFGNRAYVLYSDACIAAMGIDPAVHGLVAHEETIDIIGPVKLWVRDLEAAWESENERRRTEVIRDGAAMVLDFDIAAPRATVWEHFTLPGRRPTWQATDAVLEQTGGSRRGVGTVNHCMHGKDAFIEEIVDWRPFDYVTLTTQLPVPDTPKILMTYAFADRPNGETHVEIRIAKGKPKDKAFLDGVGAEYEKNVTVSVRNLRLMLEGQSASVAVVDEPPMLPSQERFFTEPVHGHAH